MTMSIIDITAGQASAEPDPDDRSPEDLSQDTAGTDWDVSELADGLARDPAASKAAETGAGASTGSEEIASAAGARIGTRPMFTITEAATACAVSRKTITRKLTDLAEHGAAKDEDGVWRIPVEALLAVGLHPGRSVPTPSRPAASRPATPSPTRPAAPVSSPATGSPSRGQVSPDVVTIPRDRWDDLRLRLARAEAEAAERGLALADARLALRALTAVPYSAPLGPTVPSGGEPLRPGPATPAVPPATGWVMGTAPTQPTTSGAGGTATDPGAAPPVAVVPDPPRKRRWWQSR
jgi:hypothetical protein